MESTLKRTWAEVDLDALAHNYEVICRHVGEKTKLLGVIKADAYGHGAVPVAKELEALGASYLAVSNIDECEEVRLGGVALPVLMLGFTPADQAERILALDMTQAVQSLDIAEAFSDAAVKCGKKMKVHIKLDTGMGRLGFCAMKRILTRACGTFWRCSGCRGSTWRAFLRTSASRTRRARKMSPSRGRSTSAFCA